MKRIASLLFALCLMPFLTGASFPFSFWKAAGSAGATVGVTTIGASTSVVSAGVLLWGAKFTAPVSGNITSISLYSSNTSASLKIKVGIYSNSSGPSLPISPSPVEFTPGTFSAGWKQYTGLSIPVTSGVTYWITMDVDTGSAMTVYSDAGSSGVDYFYVDSYANAWPSGPSAVADTSNLSFQAIIQ